MAVIGSAAVDLALLLIGFPCVEGWYSLEDVYSKDSFGEVKVGLVPLELLNREVIARRMEEEEGGLERSVMVEEETNFLKRRPEREVGRGEECDVKIDSVFRSLADIDTMIKSIGSAQKTEPAPVVEEVSVLSVPDPSPSQSSNSPDTSHSSPSPSSSSSDTTSKCSSTTYQSSHSIATVDPELAQESDVIVVSDENHDVTTFSDDEPCPLLDTFDITVDTECLSDTITDIAQLLEDVQRQSQNIDNIMAFGEAFSSDDLREDHCYKETVSEGGGLVEDLAPLQIILQKEQDVKADDATNEVLNETAEEFPTLVSEPCSSAEMAVQQDSDISSPPVVQASSSPPTMSPQAIAETEQPTTSQAKQYFRSKYRSQFR